METLILVSNNTLFSISILLLTLIFFIFIIKKFIKNSGKLMKYLYFIYFISIFRIFTKNLDLFHSNKAIGIFYIILSFSLIKFIDIVLHESYYKAKKDFEIPHLVRNIIVVVTFVISLLLILKNYFNVNLTSLLTTSAILSAVIGLAVQDTLTTFIAGLVLTSDKSIEIGDNIIIKDIMGRVIDTNWRTTKLMKAGGGIVNIPNNLILKEMTINYFKTSELILSIKVSASYADPPNKVKAILLDVALNNENTVKTNEPFVIISSYGDYAINYELKLWIKAEFFRKVQVESEIYTTIWYAFKRNGIKIPYPIREILTPEDMEDKFCPVNNSYFKKVEFLKNLSSQELGEIANASRLKIYGKDEYIFFQGDKGNSFFIIKSGSVSIILDGRVISKLGEGSFFGEMSLLTGNPRTASIKTLEDTEVLVIDKESFKTFIQNNKVLLENVLEYLTIREEEQLNFKEKLSLSSQEKSKQIQNIKENTLQKLLRFFEI
ncbi:MAG: mechanosensitive ion channel [Fusobacteriaceae bacterium]|nr:mechanosensitive ion channel [Fusobacteriaceae bacterium]MBU9918591.1 mechanosensitive ion channel [Fusobacteriaceae bacterium]